MLALCVPLLILLNAHCAQSNGITLTFIEKSGLIQTAENLGLLSKISDRCAPPSQGRPHIIHGLLRVVSAAAESNAPAEA